MTEIKRRLSFGWEPEPLRVELGLSDVMFDLEPRWEDWTGLEATVR